MAGDFPSNNMGCRIRFVSEPSAAGLIESALRRSLTPEMFLFWGRSFPKTSFLQMALRTQPHVPQSTRGFVYYVWAERREDRTSFPTQAAKKGKNSGKCPRLEEGKPEPRGSSMNTNKTGSVQHSIPAAAKALYLVCLPSSQYPRKMHF